LGGLFSDVPRTGLELLVPTALDWAVETGIINGVGNGRLDPQGLATRAQVAQMLKNYVESRF